MQYTTIPLIVKEIIRAATFDSVEVQIEKLSTEELFNQLSKENKKLARLGIKTPISEMAYGAKKYGIDYEDRRFPEGGIRPTPMNLFMTLVTSQRDLLSLPEAKFRELGGVISMVAMVTDTLVKKTGEIDWPEQFRKSPQA
jgi:hypothetical protein